MAEDETRHREKWVEATKEHALGDDFWLGLAAMVCFLWLSDLCVTQTARVTSSCECLSSFPYVFFLSILLSLCSPSFLNTSTKNYWKDWATWGGEAEPGGSDGLCRRSKEDRARKIKSCGKTTQWHGRENKQTGRYRVTAALVVCEVHMSNYHEKLKFMSNEAWAKNLRKEIAQSLGRRGCTLAMFLNGNRFTERRWGVGWKEMMKCVIDGRARTEKRTRKEAKWKQRTRRDRSLRSGVVLFTDGAAQSGAENCRGATDTVRCCVWCHDKFTEFRVFRNCGRGSAKRSTTMVRSMSLSWCRGFFPSILIESPRKLCEEPRCMWRDNCGVWTSIWAQTPVNVVSSPLPSFLLYFFVKSFLKEKTVLAFSLYPSIFFKNSFSYVLLFSFENVLPLTLRVWQNHTVFFIEGSSFFLDFFEELVLSPFYPSFFFSKTLPYKKKLNLLRFFVFLSYKLFFDPFFSTPFFVHHVSHSPLFSFPFLFDLFFSWSPSSWTHWSLPSLSSVFFFEQQFPFPFVSKDSSTFHFLHACVTSLKVLLLLIDLFICCLFFSSSFLCLWVLFETYLTLLHFQKLFYLFVRHLHKFLTFSFFVLFHEHLFFICFSFFLTFLDESLFWRSSLIWFSFFCPFLFSPFTSFFSKTTFFSELFPFLLSPFFFEKGSFLLLPVFSLH